MSKVASWLIVSCLLLAGCSAAQTKPAIQMIDVAGTKVYAWLPNDLAGKPVILFSHGFHGCAKQSTFLMEALAQAGYAVFAPNHRDATCGGGQSTWQENSEVPFGDIKDWNATTYADRGDDLKKLLDTLPADPRYHSLDWNRVGLAGHSLGGYTVLAVAGAWPNWKDKRVKAVLALSPYSNPFLLQGTLKNITVPVMYQGGTLDLGITPSVKKNRGAYDETPPPKYFVDLDGAGHLAWTDLRGTFHDTINAYSIAFFDTALKGKPFPESLTRKDAQVFEVLIDANK